MTTIAEQGNAAPAQADPTPSQVDDGEQSVPQAVSEKFDQVFGPRAENAPQSKAKEAAPAQQRRPATDRRARQRSAEAREQHDELVEEQLDDDGSDDAEDADPDEQAPQQANSGQQPPPPPPKARQEGAPDASTLDPALKHAARRAGWSDEEIEAFHEKDPELAQRTFQRFHGHYNDLSVQYARLAQQPPPQQMAGQQQQQQRHAAPQQQQVVDQLDRLFSPEALDEFRAVQGDDFVDRFLMPLRQQVIEPFRAMQQFVVQQQNAALAQQVETLFGGYAKDGFGDLYGDGGKQSPEQIQARQTVCQYADQIIEGAARQGINMPVAEAIDRAHMLLTAERQGEFERKKITEQVRNRSRRITARPTQRKVARTAGEGAKRSEATAMEAYAQKAAELGLSTVDDE